MNNDKLAINLREFYTCLLAVGFHPTEAMALTVRRVPEMEIDRPIQAGDVMAWTEALERWVTNVEKSEVKRAPVTRPAQAESITGSAKIKRAKIEDAIRVLCNAIGVYKNRIDEPVSLIFGNGLGLTQARKDGGHKFYTAGTNHVVDYIYENQGK